MHKGLLGLIATASMAMISLTSVRGTAQAATTPSTVAFSSSSYSVMENAGAVKISVTRTGSLTGQAWVHYATSTHGTAVGNTFTPTYGLLWWNNGDGSAKTFTVPILQTSNAKNVQFWVYMYNPGNAAINKPVTASAQLVSLAASTTPTEAAITVVPTTSTTPPTTPTSPTTPTGGGSSSLAAPANFQMTHQGADDAVLTWNAVSGANHYKIYRNGVSYATATTTTYTDAKATNITTPGYGPEPYIPATIYSYTVSAVDSSGNESAQQKQCTAWVYHNGTDFWTTTTNNYSGGLSFNVYDNSGAPASGTNDIEIKVSGGGNYWQPYSAGPFLHNMSPTQWAMELGGFHYMTIDLKPTRAGQTWSINLISRVSPGDNYNSATVVLGGSDQKFGPQSQVGKWATYKIPFVNASGFADGLSLQMGVGTFYGSISGNTLKVTQNVSGINVQGSAYLKGGSIEQGDSGSSGTYIGSSSGNNGMTGSYTVSPAQNVGSTLITAQRTNLYKFALMDPTGVAGNVYYVDNIGFTVQ